MEKLKSIYGDNKTLKILEKIIWQYIINKMYKLYEPPIILR